MKLESPDAYYAERDVPHSAQGDIYHAIPFVHATQVSPEFEAAGARKRPTPGDPSLGFVNSIVAPGIVLHYTCGITAQPPGTEGYAHEFRLMAPIVSLRWLKQRARMNNNELRKILDGRAIQGFMYLPQSGRLVLDDPSSPEDVWSDHAAALIYRPAAVSQTLLDASHLLERLTAPATKILNAAIIQTFTANDFDWETLAEPDMSNGWASQESGDAA